MVLSICFTKPTGERLGSLEAGRLGSWEAWKPGGLEAGRLESLEAGLAFCDPGLRAL